MADEGCASEIPGSDSDSKFISLKRAAPEFGHKQEGGGSCKRVKMRDLESVLSSPENNNHLSRHKALIDQLQLGDETSQITNVPVTLDLGAPASPSETSSGTAIFSVQVNPVSASLSLDPDAFSAISSGSKAAATNTNTNTTEYGDKCEKVVTLKQCHTTTTAHYKTTTGGGITLDLNAEDVTSAVNNDSFHLNKDPQHLMSRDASECGSTTGPFEEKDPLTVWKEMKQNGFLSSSHGGISVQASFVSSTHGGIPMPKQRGRKSKNDLLKKKMELAKREQVDSFTKIAAPSGLLNGLNPGIINHVRNRKQVHSIIEALVRSEKHDDCSHRGENKETTSTGDLGIHGLGLSHGTGTSNGLSRSNLTGICHVSGEEDFSIINRTCGANRISDSAHHDNDDVLGLKLSSSIKASEESISFSNEESDDTSSISSLSVKAASVASQWLELLHQDIKGRISALRRSRKRVRAVITTELPFLVSKEFSSDQGNDPSNMKSLIDVPLKNATAALHQERWSTLFDQMDKALSEEEKQLESWLNQVKEMQQHCVQGLQHFHWNTIFGLQQQGTSDNYARTVKAENPERELAVRAAAASIYSTCNFLVSKENVSCF